MMKALVFHKFGGPDVLHLEDVAKPQAKSGHVIVRTKAIGLNFADVYRRKGNYHLQGSPPYILGYEGAGVVEEVGEGVHDLHVGDRVGFCDVPFANAELVSVPLERAIPLPEDITFEQAASVLLQGLTAHYLVNDSYRVKKGDKVLVHAAAGGVGQLLTQLCKAKGARVLGLTSSEAKREKALLAGADEVMLYSSWSGQAACDWASSLSTSDEQQQQKEQQGLDVAYDSVGSTLQESFAAVRVKGTVVFYGMAGGDPQPVDPRMLMDTSKTLTGGDLWNHITTRQERVSRSHALFTEMREGRLRVEDPTLFPLARGSEAHELLESRMSTGKILLIP